MAIYMMRELPDYLCFTAEQAGSTIALNKNSSPTSVTLETSTDGSSWNTYTFGTTITLSNIGDKVYWRNTSETTTGFSTSTSNYYQFVMTGSISGSGDITSLINKNLTTTLVGDRCFYMLFASCTSLTTPPKLPATTLTQYCYQNMFSQCSLIKLSTTQTGDYQTAYKIPESGTGTTSTNSLQYMFRYTGWTFTGTPSINTTYYTSNTVV